MEYDDQASFAQALLMNKCPFVAAVNGKSARVLRAGVFAPIKSGMTTATRRPNSWALRRCQGRKRPVSLIALFEGGNTSLLMRYFYRPIRRPRGADGSA